MPSFNFKDIAQSSSDCLQALQNITKYHKMYFENLLNLYGYLRIYAIEHSLEDFDTLRKNTQVSDIKLIWASSLFLVNNTWLVGCFGFNGPLRQYFSLYRAASQRDGERGEKRYM